MPESLDPNLKAVVAAVITSLLAALGILWRLWVNDRTTHKKDMEAKDKDHQSKTEELNKSIIAHIEKSSAEMIALMQTNMENQLNGHEALKEDIDEIDKKVTGLDKKVSLMEQKLKDKS